MIISNGVKRNVTNNLILQLGSDDGLSEYGEERSKDDLSIWQELQNETVKLESRKSSSSSEVIRVRQDMS